MIEVKSREFAVCSEQDLFFLGKLLIPGFKKNWTFGEICHAAKEIGLDYILLNQEDKKPNLYFTHNSELVGEKWEINLSTLKPSVDNYDRIALMLYGEKIESSE